jgi:hypothetical protein
MSIVGFLSFVSSLQQWMQNIIFGSINALAFALIIAFNVHELNQKKAQELARKRWWRNYRAPSRVDRMPS